MTTQSPKRVTSQQDRADILEIYKLLVEMADRVSERRQNANKFYLSVSTILVGGSAYLKTLGIEGINASLIPIAGVAIGVLWIRAIGSYTALNDAKFGVINALEAKLPAQPFNDEWGRLHPPEPSEGEQPKPKKYRPFHTVEVWIPWLFIALYAAQFLIAVAASPIAKQLLQSASHLIFG